ncbi:1-phosphofructokinase family hexose kinase [Paraburkholderia rhynchosiae]|uniref:Phosphofructokinase n=1 Tax=Paraburkholderia rhynchosiae TaxID=487049 RepID=A0A2N7WA49_9BURK|nr:1-phosphofructokinase family hexose kinase [Paraburkholderia rhynchosiae]PMS26286.1 1-phosphofructokinase [Paraburkholderia rhynchosiae]CAB3730024.1 Tagatose-6-phosphate kinase [Paraburkholderia rhynchosiae]
MNTVVTVTPNPALDQTVRVANLALGEVNLAASLEFNAGGKGVNVAGCLADYGIATIATGLLGSDDAAAFDAMFADKHILDRFVRIAGRPRINVKLVDTARHETTDINLATSLPSAADVEALEQRVVELAAPGRWFVLAGSLPPGVDVSFYRRLTRSLHRAGACVALDTSGAPLADVLAASAAGDMPDLVKPNRAELEAALGRSLADDDALIEAACELVKRGIQYVVVSLGERGALGVTSKQAQAQTRTQTQAPTQERASAYEGWRAAPLRVPVASTVGAGDALVAGLVASLAEGHPWDAVGRRATAFAAGKLARVGPHLPDRATLDALAAQVELSTFSVAAHPLRVTQHQAV